MTRSWSTVSSDSWARLTSVSYVHFELEWDQSVVGFIKLSSGKKNGYESIGFLEKPQQLH